MLLIVNAVITVNAETCLWSMNIPVNGFDTRQAAWSFIIRPVISPLSLPRQCTD